MFQLAFENILHKFHSICSKPLSICGSNDDWELSLKMIYLDDYLKLYKYHHVGLHKHT